MVNTLHAELLLQFTKLPPLQTRLHYVDVGHAAQVFFQYEVVGVQASGTVVQESETVVQSSDELESVISIEPFV